VNNRVTVAPMEPRAASPATTPRATTLLLLLTGQGVHSRSATSSRAVFHMPPERVHAGAAPDVGGGFGVKNFLFPNGCWSSRRGGSAGRCAGWPSAARIPRRRAWAATTARMAAGARRRGTFLGLDVETVANLGAYLSTSGPGSSTNAPGTRDGRVYAIPAVFMEVRGAFTNTVPIDAYRGAGKPEANYIIERLVDARRARGSASIPPRSARGAT
jgi:aerobic carbon-monoxide dehydrogenase large subunit